MTDLQDILAAVEAFKEKRKPMEAIDAIINGCTPRQYDFVKDPSKRKTALCGRRAGKTNGIGRHLIEDTGKNPGVLAAYVALTRVSAKRILWAELQRMCHEHGMDVKWNNSELAAEFSNGSTIWLSGAEDAAQIEKFRGSKYIHVAIDEAASYNQHIEPLIFEVFEPALLDYDGTLSLVGTPGPVCTGTFYEATAGKHTKKWSNHRWNVFDNPHIPNAKAWVSNLKEQNGWDDNNPIYRREWLGEWVKDSDSLVYKFDPKRNVISKLPNEPMQYVVGVDLGYDDDTAVVVVGFTRHSPVLYVVEDFSKSKMIPSEIALFLRAVWSRYNPIKMVVDTGGLGKAIAEEFKMRYQIPVFPAEKKDKYDYIELFNSDLLSRRILITPDCDIQSEWRMLQWDASSTKRIIDERFPDHMSDACLYAWRESRHYRFTQKERAIRYGTPEWYEREEKEIIASLEARKPADDFAPPGDNYDWTIT